MRKLDLQDLIKKNPRVNAEVLKNVQRSSEQLRDLGVEKRGYSLAPPFGVKRAQAVDDKAQRIVRLHRP